MGFSKEEGAALNSAVRGTIERAIASLQVIGMSHEGALQLLGLQVGLRMSSDEDRRRLVKDIEGLTGDGLQYI
jgi:hypothetical protein